LLVMVDWAGYVPPGDFAYYRVFRATYPFSNVAGMYSVNTLTDPAQQSAGIGTYSDDEDYWFAVTCRDTDGNENTHVQAFGPVRSINNNAPP
jgi:hypothetical protein